MKWPVGVEHFCLDSLKIAQAILGQVRPSYLKLACLNVHGELGVVHGAHEADPRGHDEQDLVANTHPQTLQWRRKRKRMNTIGGFKRTEQNHFLHCLQTTTEFDDGLLGFFLAWESENKGNSNVLCMLPTKLQIWYLSFDYYLREGLHKLKNIENTRSKAHVHAPLICVIHVYSNFKFSTKDNCDNSFCNSVVVHKTTWFFFVSLKHNFEKLIR